MPRRRVATILAIVFASITLRALAFRQLERTPIRWMDRWTQTDMHYYETWARRIAAGDWLSRDLPLPMHRWHREIAAAYLAAHPDVDATLAAEDKEAALWARWMRAPAFYQDPLYPYLIAVVYRAGFDDPRYVIALQLGMGVLTTLLIYLVAATYFGEAAGVWAAALAVACAPLLFYELLLLRDSLVAFSAIGLVWLAERVRHRPAVPAAIAFGAALGIASLLKSTFFLFAVLAGVALLLTWRSRPRRISLAFAAAGFFVALAPAVARNVAMGVPPLSLATSGPLTFVSANEPGALPDVGFGIDAPVLTAFLAETDGGWRAALGTALHRQPLRSFVARLWRKWDRSWHWFEIPNNENFYYARLQIPVLAWLPVSFWLCGALALAGLAIGARDVRRTWPLYLLVATVATSLVAFYVLGRFRLSLLVAALPFAGLAVDRAIAWTRQRRFMPAALTVAAAGLLLVWTGRPVSLRQIEIRTADWILPYSVYYQEQVSLAADRKDWSTAADRYLEFFRYEPTNIQVATSTDPSLALELADMHAECAQLLRAAARPNEAGWQVQRAKELVALRPLH